MFEYDGGMNNPSDPSIRLDAAQLDTARLDPVRLDAARLDAAQLDTARAAASRRDKARPETVRPDAVPGVLKAMSPGVVDFLFRQLVAGEPAEDTQWQQEGGALSAQPPGAELARRLAETDLESLTPGELFHYVRAAQRLAAWAEGIREAAVSRYCATPSGPAAPAG